MTKDSKPEVVAYICAECEALVPTDDADTVGALYECGECGTVYSRDNSMDGCSHKCPDCGRFGAKVAEQGCPECEEGELHALTYA